ncbi:hypothetical protein AB6O49_00050 [Streptomyces sp. SBR177]
MTTAELPPGSAGYHLQPKANGHRDEGKALTLLRAAREASSSDKLQKAFAAFDGLEADGAAGQSALLARIDVIGDAPRIDEVRETMLGHAALVVGHDLAKPFLTRLEGWFYDRVIEQMRSPGGALSPARSSTRSSAIYATSSAPTACPSTPISPSWTPSLLDLPTRCSSASWT